MTYATVAESLRVHGSFDQAELDALIEHWHRLDARLRSFDAGTVHLDLHVKDRDRASQHVTLEATIDRLPPLVATADHRELAHALNEVRDEMVRLIGRARDKHHPRHHDASIRKREKESQ